MTAKQQYLLMVLLCSLALTLNACGASTSNQSVIATSVAMTVQAQNTQTAQFIPTSAPSTDVPTPVLSPTAFTTIAPPTAPPTFSGNVKPCYSANWISDVTIPDGTIVAPGATFWKTWRVLNSGSCSWNNTYKFVFISGDIMGGAYVYNFPGVAAPGQNVDIPIELFAPKDNGTYTGYWKIQAPDKTIFGVGQYSQSLSVTVKVVAGAGTPPGNFRTPTIYGVANVTYDTSVATRRCTTANTFYDPVAYITSNGPVTVYYDWIQSDGHSYRNRKIIFTSASTKSVSYEWSQGIGSSTNPRWVQVIITDPTYQEWPEATLPILCSQTPP